MAATVATTLNSGTGFLSGEVVTAAKLNNLVNGATVTGIVNNDIDSGAAILLSKLATGALPAAITVASANLVDGTIVNADINTSAAIVGSKLADASINAAKLAGASVTAAKLDGAQTGNAPIYGCRAWVNFNGTTSPPTIRQSGNVTSVTRNADGDFTIYFTTPMLDANYSFTASGSRFNGFPNTIVHNNARTNTASALNILSLNSSSGGFMNESHICVQVFR